MKTKFRREQVIAAGATLLLVLSFITTGLYYRGNKSLTRDLNDEKIKNERTLSEKLKLQKEIDEFKNQLASLSGKNADLDNTLEQTRKKLNEKEKEINKIMRESGDAKKLKRQVAELNELKKDFEKQVYSLNEAVKNITLQKDAIIASLQEENMQLTENLSILSSMTADNYMVEASKRNIFGNEKLTAVAKRTRKMTMSFSMPENVVDKISFKITGPDGITIDGKDKAISFRVINEDDGLTACSSNDEIKVSKRIEMTYEPKQKLTRGVYKIEMLNRDKYIGSCNVKLR